MAFFVRTVLNNITAMYEEVEAEEIRPVFGMQIDESTSSRKFDSGIGGVSLDPDLNTSATSSSVTSSSMFSKPDMSDEKIEEFQTQSIEVTANVGSMAQAENGTGGSQEIEQFETQALEVGSNLPIMGTAEKVTVAPEKVEDVIDDGSRDRNYIEIYSPETARSRAANRRRKRDQYDEPLENFLARRKKAKEKKKTFSKKVQSFITNFFSTNKVKTEKKGQDYGHVDILSSKQYNYTPRMKVGAMDEPEIEVIEVVAAPVFKPNQPPVVQKFREMPSASTPVGKSASAAYSVNPEKDVIADTIRIEEVLVHAEGEVKPSLQCELPSENVVEECDDLQKQVQQLSQEMAQMKEVMSRKRSLPGLMYMKSKIVRKSKKSLKIEAKKKTGKSKKKTTLKDPASGSEDGANPKNKQFEISSLEIGNEPGKDGAAETEDGANKKNEQSEMSALEIGNEPGKDGVAGTEDGANKKNEQSEMSALEIGNEPGKDGVAGTEDGTKKTEVDLAMSPLKNAEIKDTKDDGTSIKKNEVYPTSNLGVHGEFRAVQDIIESTDTTSHGDGVRMAMENTSESLRLVLDDDVQTPELLTDVLKQRSEGTNLLLGENAACTAADDIQKKKYVRPELDDGDEYSDNECIVADSVSKEDSEKRTDANDVCGNAKDLTEEKKTLYYPEKIDTMNPLPAENEDDLLGNQSEVAASDLDLDEHQENKLLGEDNGNQTEANKSSRPTSDETYGNEYVDGEENEYSEGDEGGSGDYSYDGEEGDDNVDEDDGFSGDAVEDEVYDDGQDTEVGDDDPDPERGNGSHGPDATLMDSTYTGIGSMDMNSTVQSVGQISKPQQSSTPVRTQSAMIDSPDNSTTPKPRTGIIAKENSVFYSKQQQKRRMASPTSTEVPVKIQAGIRNTGNQPNNAMT